ncbi:helix-turn-helix domain-containing protein [Actinomycetospora flava]|uniref:Helix-turn-helix domain-containing protein n=1 Tax=Actinomycetospora flava TaxID=3129232 RepID=A0ABU8M543_9PSEU
MGAGRAGAFRVGDESFDAASVPAPLRRRTWSEVTARFLVPLEIDAPSATVDGTIAARRRGGFTLCGVSATAHTAVRTAGLARGAGGGQVKVAVPVRGVVSVTQDGRRADLVPGEIAVYDTSRPYTVGGDGPFGLVVALLPRDALAIGESRLERLVARRLRGAALGPVRSGLLALTDARTSDRDRELVLDRLVRLAPGREGEGRSVHDAAVELIARRLGSPTLTPDYLADVLGVSRRTLYLAFAGQRRSVAATIRHARLERARALLADPDGAAPVADVAAAVGMAGPTQLGRLFRAEFGTTPSAYRASVSAGDVARIVEGPDRGSPSVRP